MTNPNNPNKAPLAQVLQRLAELKARKAQPAKLDPRLEMFAQGGIDIYEKPNDEE
jgi:hypothetical protein